MLYPCRTRATNREILSAFVSSCDSLTANALFEERNRLWSKENENKSRCCAAWQEVRLHLSMHMDGERCSGLNTMGRAASIQSDFLHISFLIVGQ